MKRRDALKNIGKGFGYTVSYPALVSVFSSCQEAGKGVAGEIVEAFKPSFLSGDSYALLEHFADVILPATNSPGAKELKILQVADTYAEEMWDDEERSVFNKGLEVFTSMLKSDYDLKDNNLAPEKWTALADKYLGPASAALRERGMKFMGKKESEIAEGDKEFYYLSNFMGTFKSMAIGSYFANETIAQDHLTYDKVPGKYIGCVSLSEVGNSYSINW